MLIKLNQFLNKYFFSPGSLKDLALIRIVVVAVQLFFLLSSSDYSVKANPGSNLDFQQWLTTIEQSEFKPTLILKIFTIPLGIERPGFELIEIIWWVTLITALLSLSGFFTNISLAFLSFGTTFLIGHFYSYQEYHHTESVLVIFLWILTFSRCGYMYSFDYLMNKKRKDKMKTEKFYDVYARWPVLVMQWIFVLVYFSAGFEKITSGIEWMNGYTLSYNIAQDSLSRNIPLGLSVSSNIGLMILFSVSAVIFETFFFIIMIFPQITWIFIFTGAAFHTSVYVLHGPPFIQYVILYIVFIEPIRQTLKNKNFFKIKLKTSKGV